MRGTNGCCRTDGGWQWRGLRGSPNRVDLPKPDRHLVPTGASLVHSTFAHACHKSVSYGRQATRRLSTVAREAAEADSSFPVSIVRK